LVSYYPIALSLRISDYIPPLATSENVTSIVEEQPMEVAQI
jgi:hypothetical protein